MSRPAADMFTGFHFDPETHTYTLNGRRLPSVTEVIGPLKNLSAIPAHVLERARERGKAVHAAIHYHHEGDLAVDTLDLQIVPYFEAWLKFLGDTGFKVMEWETPLHSTPFQYAGTPDLWGQLGTDLWLPDIKTTAAIMPEDALQTAAYRRLVEEHAAIKCRRATLQLRDDGTYRFHPYPQAEDATDMSIFMACLAMHNWKEKHHGRSRTD